MPDVFDIATRLPKKCKLRAHGSTSWAIIADVLEAVSPRKTSQIGWDGVVVVAKFREFSQYERVQGARCPWSTFSSGRWVLEATFQMIGAAQRYCLGRRGVKMTMSGRSLASNDDNG